MVSNLTVSVIIPAHNAGSTIGMALSSVLAQSFESWEAIVIDDGSTDNTSAVVQGYADRRIRLLHQAQSGAAAARNTGLKEATGDLVAFLDADDLLLPLYLETSHDALAAATKKTIVTHNAYYLTTEGLSMRAVRHSQPIPTSPKRQQSAMLRSNFASILTVFPRQMLEEVGFFDTSLERVEDWDYWIRAVFSGWNFIHQRRPLAIINRTGDSLTTASVKVAESEARVLQKTLGSQLLTDRQKNEVERRLAIGEPTELRMNSLAFLKAREYRVATDLHLKATIMQTRSPRALAKAIAFRCAPKIVGSVARTQL